MSNKYHNDNVTTVAKLGFFLEAHRERLMIPESYLENLCKYRPLKPHYLERKSKQPQKMISKWNLIVALSLINREWNDNPEKIVISSKIDTDNDQNDYIPDEWLKI